jgi:hypothetical protein
MHKTPLTIGPDSPVGVINRGNNCFAIAPLQVRINTRCTRLPIIVFCCDILFFPLFFVTSTIRFIFNSFSYIQLFFIFQLLACANFHGLPPIHGDETSTELCLRESVLFMDTLLRAAIYPVLFPVSLRTTMVSLMDFPLGLQQDSPEFMLKLFAYPDFVESDETREPILADFLRCSISYTLTCQTCGGLGKPHKANTMLVTLNFDEADIFRERAGAYAGGLIPLQSLVKYAQRQRPTERGITKCPVGCGNASNVIVSAYVHVLKNTHYI